MPIGPAARRSACSFFRANTHRPCCRGRFGTMMDGELLKEIALAGPEHLDPDYVAGYDQKARIDPKDDLIELGELGLAAGCRLFDLGGGTATFALAAAAICKRVVAVDVSPAMVEAMCAKVAEQGNVECVQ